MMQRGNSWTHYGGPSPVCSLLLALFLLATKRSIRRQTFERPWFSDMTGDDQMQLAKLKAILLLKCFNSNSTILLLS